MAKSKPQAEIKSNLPFWQNDKIMAWLFFGFAFLLYAQTISYDYALDDRAVTFSNKFVMKGFAGIGDILKTFYWAGFWDSNSGLFRPISLILFAIEWKLFPNAPHVYHFVNVVLYAICALLLYRTLREIFRDFTLALPVLATLLWIVFPAHTEVVANIKSGDEILSMIFFLLSVQQLLKWEKDESIKPLLLSGVFFFLSLLSKEGAVLFLPILFMIIYLFRKIELNKLIKPGIVLFAFVAVWFAWHSAVISNAPTEKITYTYHDNSLVGAPNLSSRVATAIQMQGEYLLKSFTSFPLSYDYSFNENPYTSFGNIFVIVSFLVCVSLFVFAILKFKKEPVLSFGILFYFITFALTSNVFILIGATMADRFLFVPSLGFVIALTWGILKLTKVESIKYFHANAMYVLIPLVLLYSIRTFSRSSDWKYESTLFTADVENSPGSARVHYNYGVLLMADAAGAADESNKAALNAQAYQQFTTAFDIDSLDFQSCYNLGVVEYRRKNYAESVKWSQQVLKINPNDNSILLNLADAMTMAGKFDSAVVVYKKAIDKNLIGEDTWNMLGFVYLNKRDTIHAIDAFENSVKHDPKSIKNWDKLGNVCGMNKKFQRSNEAFLEITKLDPSNPTPYKMIATNYLAMKDSVTAMQYYSEYQKRGGK